ncbi:MAG: YeeE/YedE family protein [Gammaproteobacteria bacterium]
MQSPGDLSSGALGPTIWGQRAALLSGLVAVTLVTATLLADQSRMALLFGIGLLLGLALYHGAFGFTSAYRKLFLHFEVSGVQAQLVLVGLTTLLFAPLLASGSAFGQGLGGAFAPFALQVAVGAFMFGIGMQLGGGCGSGTLFGVGGGSLRMVITLVAFITGSFWASLHMGWWQSLPSMGTLSLGKLLGWPAAVALQLGVLIAIALLLRRWGKSTPPTFRALYPDWRSLLRGPWPLLFTALILALLGALTLIVAGHPWSITWAFTLWGAKVAALLGWDPATSGFWNGAFQQTALNRSIFKDVTSVMNIGIVIGALCAAALAQRFASGSTYRIPLASLLAAILGGILMGYGARIAFGCNIGAFLSGVGSTSLHGWLWILAALPGNWLGTRLRPRFGLQN